MAYRGPVVIVDISDILAQTERGIRVVLRRTGKTAWLPKRDLDYLPGAVMMPAWLARKIFCNAEKNASAK